MGVLYDVGSERHLSASAAVRTHTHTATIANVAGILVGFVKGTVNTDVVTAVSANGVNLVRVNRATDTATEPGAAEWWFASGIGSGQIEVIYNTSAPASNLHAVVITVTSPHTPYVIGAQTKGENTTSHSVSLTTGYVSGMAFGAFYGGGGAVTSLTYSVDRTLVHDWDMGAFYSEFFRHTSPTTDGDGPVIGFGGDASTDDLAFAAVFITDGSITTTKGQLTVSGLVPEVIGELSVGPPVGLVAAGQLEPVVEGDVFPGVGSVVTVGQIPGYPAEPLNTHEPTLVTELRQEVGVGGIGCVGQIPGEHVTLNQNCGVGIAGMVGLTPSLQTIALIGPSVGAITGIGQIPGEYRELNQGIGLGSAVIGGQAPSCLGDGSLGPGQGLMSCGGLVPTLATERLIVPGVGLAILEGREVTVTGDSGTPVVEGTAEPGVGLVTLDGREPTVDASGVRGHVVKKKRRRGSYGPEIKDVSAGVQVSVVLPTRPTEVVEIEPAPLAALDTGEIEGKITTLETRRSRLARMRREEEELIAILMRVA